MSRRDEFTNRYIIPDLYPRRDDPFRPGAIGTPTEAPGAAQGAYGPIEGAPTDVAQLLTVPGTRPVVYQRAINFTVNLTIANVPVALSNGQLQCDTIVLDVYSTAGASAFFGYSNAVTTSSGIEIRPGLPIVITPENSREQWELQRVLEAMSVMLGYASEPYRAPRVVFDASAYFLVAATVPLAVSVMIFLVPEFQ